jgi:hypothetical protein
MNLAKRVIKILCKSWFWQPEINGFSLIWHGFLNASGMGYPTRQSCDALFRDRTRYLGHPHKNVHPVNTQS